MLRSDFGLKAFIALAIFCSQATYAVSLETRINGVLEKALASSDCKLEDCPLVVFSLKNGGSAEVYVVDVDSSKVVSRLKKMIAHQVVITGFYDELENTIYTESSKIRLLRSK